MVKIFVGRLVESITAEKLTEMFSKYGEVIDCEVKKNFGFIHMAHKKEAEEAIRELDKSEVEGQAINVEFSNTKVASASKIFVGNLAEGTKSHELHKLFKPYGTVIECDVVKNFGFVHMSRESNAREAIKELNNYELNGNQIRVQMAKANNSNRSGGRDSEFGGQGYGRSGARYSPYDDYYDMGPRSRLPRGPMGGSPYERAMRRDAASRGGGASYMRLLRAERAMLARRLRQGYGDAYARSALAGSRLTRGLDAGAYTDFADDYSDLAMGDDFLDPSLDRYGGPAYGAY